MRRKSNVKSSGGINSKYGATPKKPLKISVRKIEFRSKTNFIAKNFPFKRENSTVLDLTELGKQLTRGIDSLSSLKPKKSSVWRDKGTWENFGTLRDLKRENVP